MNSESKIFIGRMGINPELKYTKESKPVCYLSVAMNDNITSISIWKKVIVFGKQAELCNQYLKKGNQIFIKGKIVEKEFKNKDGSIKRYFELISDLIGFTLL